MFQENIITFSLIKINGATLLCEILQIFTNRFETAIDRNINFKTQKEKAKYPPTPHMHYLLQKVRLRFEQPKRIMVKCDRKGYGTKETQTYPCQWF